MAADKVAILTGIILHFHSNHFVECHAKHATVM